MALFAERDFRSMPKINQFVQLTRTQHYAGSELDKWVYRQMTGDLSNKDAMWSGSTNVSAAHLRSLDTLIELLESILSSIADRGKIKQTDLVWLNSRLTAPAPKGEIQAYPEPFSEKNTTEQEYSVSNLILPQMPMAFLKHIETHLLDEMLHALRYNSTEHIRFCTVCHNPFIAGKRDQLVCSFRDNTRAAMRRMRRKDSNQEEIRGEQIPPIVTKFSLSLV